MSSTTAGDEPININITPQKILKESMVAHPILKYKMVIVFILLIFFGMLFIFIIHAFTSDKNITGHSFWKHLFVEPNMREYDDSNTRDDIYDYRYSNMRASSAAVFRKAIETFDTKTLPKEKDSDGKKTSASDGKSTAKDGSYSSADVDGAKEESASKKNTPCSTDCGQYVALQGKINTLSKMVDEVKAQKDKIKQVGDGIQAVGNEIKNLSKSLAPNGKFKAKL
jgi:hypothetical protein